MLGREKSVACSSQSLNPSKSTIINGIILLYLSQMREGACRMYIKPSRLLHCLYHMLGARRLHRIAAWPHYLSVWHLKGSIFLLRLLPLSPRRVGLVHAIRPASALQHSACEGIHDGDLPISDDVFLRTCAQNSGHAQATGKQSKPL